MVIVTEVAATDGVVRLRYELATLGQMPFELFAKLSDGSPRAMAVDYHRRHLNRGNRDTTAGEQRVR